MSLLPYFYDFEDPFAMERDFFGPRLMSPFNWNHRRFARPFFKDWEHALWDLRPLEQLSNQMGQLAVKDVGTVDDKERFQVSVDVQHFSPEEISVKVIDGYVVVEGKHEEKQDSHGYISRQFVRRYTLPEGCLPDTVESQLSSDGVLTVGAPKVLPLPSIGEKIVPITKTGPIKKQLSSPGPEIETEAKEEKMSES